MTSDELEIEERSVDKDREVGSGPRFVDLDDEELLRQALETDPPWRVRLLEELYRRHYPRVARWSCHLCGDRDQAADLAQEVFLRVHRSIDSYRFQCRFGTWLYTITRNTAINRGIAARRHEADPLDEELAAQIAERGTAEEEVVDLRDRASWLRRTIRHELEPLEAKVLILHCFHGMTLPAVTERLGLGNRSGAKAFLVAAKRKLLRAAGSDRTSESTRP